MACNQQVKPTDNACALIQRIVARNEVGKILICCNLHDRIGFAKRHIPEWNGQNEDRFCRRANLATWIPTCRIKLRSYTASAVIERP